MTTTEIENKLVYLNASTECIIRLKDFIEDSNLSIASINELLSIIENYGDERHRVGVSSEY